MFKLVKVNNYNNSTNGKFYIYDNYNFMNKIKKIKFFI